MKLLKVASLGSLLALNVLSANAYDVTERFKLINDKLKTEALLRPIGHDFFFEQFHGQAPRTFYFLIIL